MPLSTSPISSKQSFFFRNYAVKYKTLEHHSITCEDGMIYSNKDINFSSPVSLDLLFRKCENSELHQIGRITICGDSINHVLSQLINIAREVVYKPLDMIHALNEGELIFEENPHFRTMLDFQEEAMDVKDKLYEIQQGILAMSREAHEKAEKALDQDQMGMAEYTEAKDKEEILLKVLELFSK